MSELSPKGDISLALIPTLFSQVGAHVVGKTPLVCDSKSLIYLLTTVPGM